MLHILFELKELAECRSRAADKLVVLVERMPRPADKLDGLAERDSRVTDKSGFVDGSRAAGKVFWELLVALCRPNSCTVVINCIRELSSRSQST